jgi:two-component system sensor histidine kinase KdpD
MEIGEGYWAMSLVFGMKSVGTLAWRPAVLSHEVASAVTAQVAIALTRSLALEGSARLEAARSGDRLRTALIDSLTHELRTPLTSIRAAATTLQDAGEMDAETRDELAAIMVEESARLDKLIGEAIEMAQIDAEGVAIHRVAMQTRVLLEQAAEESRGQLSGHRVVIQVEGADSPARFDPNLMRRVLRHVLENAARYTPAGSRIVLRSRRVGDRVELLVEDNGPGIDVYDLPLIFEKFYRGKAGGRGGKGSGMGLAITRAILAAHGGAIGVESTPGKGTTFRIEFPAGDPLGDVGGAAGGASGMLEA